MSGPIQVVVFGKKPNEPVTVNGGKLSADVSGSTVDASGSTVDASGSQVDATTSPLPAEATTTKSTVGTSSTQLADEDTTRAQIVLQNTHSTNSIFVNLGGTATEDDLKIPPGGTFSFPPGIIYQGEINAIADDVDTNYVLIVYTKS